MKVAIIIGFSYLLIKKDDYNYLLPGIVLDLYMAYQYAISIACDKILVVSDHTDLVIDRQLLNLLYEGEVDVGVTNFFKLLYTNRQLLEYTTMDNLNVHLRDTGKGATRLFFYYSGHAHNGMILVPKNTNLQLFGLTDLISCILTER